MRRNTSSDPLRRGIGAVIIATLVLAPLATRAQEEPIELTSKSADKVSGEKIVHINATVKAVDLKARTLTLAGPRGEFVFNVSDEVKRLSEIKVGDELNIGYMQAVGLDLREPTAEDLKNPLQIAEASDKADKSRAPAGAETRTIRAVVTLEGMDRYLETITVRGPRGNFYELDVDAEKIKWETLRIGQQMVATYSETLVMSIDPVKK